MVTMRKVGTEIDHHGLTRSQLNQAQEFFQLHLNGVLARPGMTISCEFQVDGGGESGWLH